MLDRFSFLSLVLDQPLLCKALPPSGKQGGTAVIAGGAGATLLRIRRCNPPSCGASTRRNPSDPTPPPPTLGSYPST
jgi:hypothetical protein